MQDAAGFEIWLQQLRQLATERELQWLIGVEPETHRAAFAAGRSAEQELMELADLAQWRGCGCGGGG